jgi:hypothetical protein
MSVFWTWIGCRILVSVVVIIRRLRWTTNNGIISTIVQFEHVHRNRLQNRKRTFCSMCDKNSYNDCSDMVHCATLYLSIQEFIFQLFACVWWHWATSFNISLFLTLIFSNCLSFFLFCSPYQRLLASLNRVKHKLLGYHHHHFKSNCAKIRWIILIYNPHISLCMCLSIVSHSGLGFALVLSSSWYLFCCNLFKWAHFCPHHHHHVFNLN